MRTPIRVLAVLSVILLTTETARSREKGEHHRSQWREKMLEKYDVNGDGELDEEERQAIKKAWAEKWKNHKGRWSEAHNKYDKDGDGNLDEEERTAMKKAWAEKWKNRRGARSKSRRHHHKDGDGRFHSKRHARHKGSAEKWKNRKARWSEIRKQYDKDGDGNLDDEERSAMKKAWAEKRKNRKGARSKSCKHHHKGGDGRFHSKRHARHKGSAKKWGKHGGFDLSRHLMTRLDANKDGEISADEVPEKLLKHFKNVDADADGTVNQKEIHRAVNKAKTKFISHVQSHVFDKIDQNDDGKLDIEKIVAKLHAGLNKIDTSGDGFIDRSEFKAITSSRQAKQDASSQ